MSKKLCVYTCITGNYDNLHEIEVIEENVDYLCFTNNKNLKSATWQIIQIDNDGLDNHHLSRKIKMLGHPIISKNYDTSVWMDASIIWQKKINEFVKTYLKDKPFAAFKHSQRNSVHDEAVACLRFHKDTKENILHTLDFLNSEHFPDNLGLYEMTVFIKKHNDPKVIETMQLWFNINCKYSKRDQLSFTYAIWKTNLKINRINLSVCDNNWFHSSTHAKQTLLENCCFYFGDSSKEFDFNKYQIERYHKKDGHLTITTTIPNDTRKIEISPIDSVGILYKNLHIKPKPDKILLPDAIPYNNGSILYIEHDIFRIFSHYKKGQTISLSIDIKILDRSELFQVIQQLKAEQSSLYDTINNLQHDKDILFQNIKNTTDSLYETDSQLRNVLNSKSWKTIRTIKKLFPHR